MDLDAGDFTVTMLSETIEMALISGSGAGHVQDMAACKYEGSDGQKLLKEVGTRVETASHHTPFVTQQKTINSVFPLRKHAKTSETESQVGYRSFWRQL